MRIGILTFHRSVNNGAVMQCYALSKRIKQDFPNDVVEVIDYHMPKIEQKYSVTLAQFFKSSSMILMLKKAYQLLREPDMFKKNNQRNAVFKNAITKLPLSRDRIFDDNDEELVDYINSHYDILIVGSDAVWNYVTRGFPNAYFPDERIKCYKLSYAASCFGMEFLNCPQEDRIRIGQILERFEFIGVRDTATEDFVKWSKCIKTPVHTCDPTALLDVENLPIDVNLLNKKLIQKGFDLNKPTIGVMGNEKMVNMIRKFYGNKYQIAALYNYTKGADIQLFDLEPYEWAYVFRYFGITFTTYFHGTMLSLRNGVPVICIALKTEFAKQHVPKTLDVLRRLGYEDWYFKTDYTSENLNKIKTKADQLLSTSNSKEIRAKVNKEAESYKSFQIALETIKNRGMQ